MITLTKISAFTIETPKALPHPRLHVIVREDGKVLTPRKGWYEGCTTLDRYKKVCARGKAHLVHRLVAETFITNTEDKPTVDHINRVRDDNRVENLRWATHREQRDNSAQVLDARDLGVRRCDDPKEYARRNSRLYYSNKSKDPEWVEKERIRLSNYRKTEKGRANARERVRRYRERKKARSEEQASLTC